MVHRPSEPPPLDHCCRTRMQSLRSQSTGRTGRREIRRARLPRLGGGRLAGHRVSHPLLKPRPTGALAPAGNREGGQHRSRPIVGRRLPQEDAANARAKVRCPADRECVDVERSLLKPSGVVGDERERAETDLAALHQNSARNHDDLKRKRLQLLQQLTKTPAPRWAPTVVVLSLTVV